MKINYNIYILYIYIYNKKTIYTETCTHKINRDVCCGLSLSLTRVDMLIGSHAF